MFASNRDEDGRLHVGWSAGAMPLLQANRGVRRIYIDLNHWIGLTKVRLGKPDSEPYRQVYHRLEELVESGDVVLPISAVHYEEIGAIADPRQRVDLALTID